MTKALTATDVQKDSSRPDLAARLRRWGYRGGWQRTFQGESRRLTLVVSRSLTFGTGTGAAAFVAYLEGHINAFYPFAISKPLAVAGPGRLADQAAALRVPHGTAGVRRRHQGGTAGQVAGDQRPACDGRPADQPAVGRSRRGELAAHRGVAEQRQPHRAQRVGAVPGLLVPDLGCPTCRTGVRPPRTSRSDICCRRREREPRLAALGRRWSRRARRTWSRPRPSARPAACSRRRPATRPPACSARLSVRSMASPVRYMVTPSQLTKAGADRSRPALASPRPATPSRSPPARSHVLRLGNRRGREPGPLVLLGWLPVHLERSDPPGQPWPVGERVEARAENHVLPDPGRDGGRERVLRVPAAAGNLAAGPGQHRHGCRGRGDTRSGRRLPRQAAARPACRRRSPAACRR